MAKKSLADLQAQIEKLQAQADQLREKEKAGVVARIRESITAYELSEADLFGKGASRTAQPKRGKSAADRSAAYADGNGNVWGGRGPRPRWLREALQQGRTLDEFKTGGRATNAGPTSGSAQPDESPGVNGAATSRRGAGKAVREPRGAAGKSPAAKLPVKYRDDAGNTWSGRGLKPKWLKDALAAGSTLETYQVNA